MRINPTISSIVGLVALSACNSQSSEAGGDIVASARISDADDTEVGEAKLHRADGLLTLTISLSGLTEGSRAFHLHETGNCEAPSFTSAGGHLNPFAKAHGKLNEGGAHLGDLPNIVVAADGTFSGEFPLNGSADDLLPSLFDEDGTAIMLHEGPDDYLTDPSGAAGPRLACGVLERA